MKSHYRVVVIGGGIVGTSILYHLARRGWAEKSDVLNTLPVTKLLAALKGGNRKPGPKAARWSRPARAGRDR